MSSHESSRDELPRDDDDNDNAAYEDYNVSEMSPVVSPLPALWEQRLIPLQLVGRNENCEVLLTSETAEQIRPHLPPLLRESTQWELLYSNDQHGTSLATLFGRVTGPAVMVVEDVNGKQMGAFASERLGMQKGYYGNGASFLWRLNERGSVTVYLSTGKNDYYILSETGANVAFGGGAEGFGLWLDDHFVRGHTSPCSTYDNEPLTGAPAGEAFECFGVEVWGFKL
ncbi:TLD-domain-containing protein [Phlyctochytrium arcticum]|nr:TLD-domain-containing protein [Phlyctochytrium arcticum]